MSQTKLLLIDDERPLLMNVKEILELEGFEVVTGSNGFEGLAQFEKEKPDFVFYLCGVDILSTDKFGKLNISLAACKIRDIFVFELCKRHCVLYESIEANAAGSRATKKREY